MSKWDLKTVIFMHQIFYGRNYKINVNNGILPR